MKLIFLILYFINFIKSMNFFKLVKKSKEFVSDFEQIINEYNNLEYRKYQKLKHNIDNKLYDRLLYSADNFMKNKLKLN